MIWKHALICLAVASVTAQASVETSDISETQAIRQADSVVIGRMGPAVTTEQVVLSDQYDDFGNPTEIVLTVDVHEFNIESVVSGDVATDTVLVRRVRTGNEPAAVSHETQMIGLQGAHGSGANADGYVVVHDVAIDAPPDKVAQLSRWAQDVRAPEAEHPQAAMELAYGDTGNFDPHQGHDHAEDLEDFLIDESTDDRVEPAIGNGPRTGPQDATADNGVALTAAVRPRSDPEIDAARIVPARPAVAMMDAVPSTSVAGSAMPVSSASDSDHVLVWAAPLSMLVLALVVLYRRRTR